MVTWIIWEDIQGHFSRNEELQNFGVGENAFHWERFASLCNFLSGKGDTQQNLQEEESSVDRGKRDQAGLFLA